MRLPSYLGQSVRREIGEMYASVAIADLAMAIVAIFEPIFLYSVVHLSIPQILLLNGLTYFVYIFAIPFGARICSQYGYEHGILFSIPFQILFWVFLYAGQDNHWMLLPAFIFFGIEKSLYWPAFHASVSRFARDDQRGREFSLLYAIFNLVSIIGPFIGGMLSERFGVRLTFVLAAAVYTMSFIPLFTTKEVFIPKLYQYRDTWEMYKALPRRFFGYAGFGEEIFAMHCWPIFIYVVVAGYEKVGLLVTVATFIATALALYIGKITDRYTKSVLIRIGSFFYSLVWLARLVTFTPYGVFFADALSRTSKDLVFIPLSSYTYEQAEATHIMPYVVFFEQSLSVGKLSACLLGSAAFWLATGPIGLSFAGGFVILFIMAGLFSLLYSLI